LIVTGEQLRAARAMARIEQIDLARKAAVSVDTIKRLERTVGPISADVATMAAVVSALEAAGVIFVEENGEGPGVRLRKARPSTGDKEALPDVPKSYDGSPV
jgi:transcriptional regulator with XRE-family HTH domain